MKVILQNDVPGLGEAGDIKDVSNGYVRNYLLPKKMVIVSNEVSKKAIEHQSRLIKIKKEKRKNQIEKLVDSLSNLEIHIGANVGEEGKLFGSVTTIDIAKKLITMYGYEPDNEIKIEITGSRPGEKLYEELYYEKENLNRTKNAKIYLINSDIENFDIETIRSFLTDEISNFGGFNSVEIRRLLKSLVPEYDTADIQE